MAHSLINLVDGGQHAVAPGAPGQREYKFVWWIGRYDLTAAVRPANSPHDSINGSQRRGATCEATAAAIFLP